MKEVILHFLKNRTYYRDIVIFDIADIKDEGDEYSFIIIPGTGVLDSGHILKTTYNKHLIELRNEKLNSL